MPEPPEPPGSPRRRVVAAATAPARPVPSAPRTVPPAAGPGGRRIAAADPAAGPPATPTAPTPDGGAPAGGTGRRRRPRRPWYRPKLRWITLYLPLFLLLAALLAGLWGWQQLRSLGRVDVGDALAAPAGEARNYLIVGSDSREGLDPDVENAGAIGLDVTGRRSDTIIVLRLAGGTATMTSIPRDLWVRNPATGRDGRINATYAAGADNLIRAVSSSLGIPIHRYVEVDFKSFGSMVDALGGITIDFPHPVKDHNSGLNVLRAGPARLDGSQALAYVRSRHYTEIIDGREVTDPTADLGRQQRQQGFIRALLGEVSDVRNPVTLVHLAGAASSGMRVDQDFGAGDALDLARRLSGASPTSVVLPTEPARRGGAAVLLLREADARPVLSEFGAT